MRSDVLILWEEIRQEALDASKTWMRFEWPTPACEVKVLTPETPVGCPICHTPLNFLLYPTTGSYPVMVACLPCNLAAGNIVSFDDILPKGDWLEQRLIRAGLEAYCMIVARIARDVPGYVQERNIHLSKRS